MTCIGKVYMQREEYALAIEIQKEAYEIALMSEAKLDMTTSLLGLAETYVQQGDIVSSILTYKKAENLRASLHVVKKENLLLETDAPYLSPQKVRWQQNKPSHVKYLYEFVAEELSLDIEDLATQLEKNFFWFYKAGE